MPQHSAGHQFNTTRWSLVAAGGRSDARARRAALNQLIETYWYPLYAYLRRHGRNSAEAEDLTQAFLAELIEKNAFAVADRQRGRFRTFLLSSLRHFLINEHERAAAIKRGGGRRNLPLDFSAAENRYSRGPSHDLTPERLYERRWALALLDQVLEALEKEFEAGGKGRLWTALKPGLTGADSKDSNAEIGAKLGMSSDAVKTAALRMRRRYRDMLRVKIADTVASPDEIDDELGNLFAALS